MVLNTWHQKLNSFFLLRFFKHNLDSHGVSVFGMVLVLFRDHKTLYNVHLMTMHKFHILFIHKMNIMTQRIQMKRMKRTCFRISWPMPNAHFHLKNGNAIYMMCVFSSTFFFFSNNENKMHTKKQLIVCDLNVFKGSNVSSVKLNSLPVPHTTTRNV